MSVYRVCEDFENFLSFDCTPEELQSKMGENFLYMLNLSGPEAQPDWIKPNGLFRLDEQNTTASQLPDISYWATSHPVFNQKAYNALATPLESYGEFLPVNVQGNTYYIFNILNVLDESFIDLDKSEQEFETIDGETMRTGLHKLQFKENLLNDTLVFKTAYDDYINVFCNDKFKQLVEEADLKGITFKLDLASVF